MNATPRVRGFIFVLAVEVPEAVLIIRKVRRHPIEYHADPILVKTVDQVHEFLRRSVTARRCEESGDLVSPRAEERVLHYRHKLDVREAHFLYVRNQLICQFAIGEKAISFVCYTPPGAEMHLIYRHRCIERVCPAPAFHPGAVTPA